MYAGAMAHRGDLIGCKILFEKSRDEEIPVHFTLNGQVIGEATIKEGQDFHPFIAIGWEGIVLLFKVKRKKKNILISFELSYV